MPLSWNLSHNNAMAQEEVPDGAFAVTTRLVSLEGFGVQMAKARKHTKR